MPFTGQDFLQHIADTFTLCKILNIIQIRLANEIDFKIKIALKFTVDML